MSLIENFRNIFKIEDLRDRILYVVGILLVYRIGSYVTMPGVDANMLTQQAGDASSLLGLFDLFVGGRILKGRSLCTRYHALYNSCHYHTANGGGCSLFSETPT